MLQDKPRGRPVEIDGSQRAKLTALACSEAPTGHARWDFGSWRIKPSNSVIAHICRIRMPARS